MTTIRHMQYTVISEFLQIGNYRGSNLSGISGATSRVLTLPNTRLTENEQIFLDGLNLHSSLYSVSRAASNTTITVLRPVWDDQRIVVPYWLI